MKTILGNSWVGWLNIIILQWFFVRLFYQLKDNGEILGYGLLLPVVPLTGWWNDYVPAKPSKLRFFQ
jgi:hypothetical protein